MRRNFFVMGLLTFFSVLFCVKTSAFEVSSGKTGGIARCGEAVTFSFSGKLPERTAFLRVRTFINGRCTGNSVVPAAELKPVVLSTDRPGWLAVKAVPLDAEKKVLKTKLEYGDGVLVEPGKLVPARPVPADFDKFWQDQLAGLAKIPMSPQRTAVRLDAKNARKLLCEEIKLQSAGDIPVTGYLVMPRKAAKRSLPALVCYHGAGYKSSSKQITFGKNAIVFDVNAHGLPNGRPREFYRKLNKGPTRGCIFYDRDDREKSYVKQMFLRAARATEFIRSLPEWDGRTLIVFGRSQGGAQALAAAALVPEVTLCVANVPALGDHGGREAGRLPGWPQLNRKLSGGASEKQIASVSDYVDVVNLAKRIKSPVHLTAGAIDFVCAPTSVALVRNNIAPELLKSFRIFQRMGHEAPPVKDDNRKYIFEEFKK